VFYRVDEQRKEFEQAQAKADATTGFFNWLTGRQRTAQENAEALRLGLKNSEWRLAEAIRAIDKNRPEWAKQQELAKHGLQGAGSPRSQQERESVEAAQDKAEKENTVLQEAQSSPQKAAELQHSVTARSTAQRGKVAAVQQQARQHDAERITKAKDKVMEQEQAEATRDKQAQGKTAQEDKAQSLRQEFGRKAQQDMTPAELATERERLQAEYRGTFAKPERQEQPPQQIAENPDYKPQRDMNTEELEAEKARLMEEYKAEFARQEQERGLDQERGMEYD